MHGIVIGLAGLRCSGKSTVRSLLSDYSVPVFDTNSVSTGDFDSDTIDPPTILTRYGNGESYFRFLAPHLLAFAEGGHPVWFIDSLKASNDPNVIRELLPSIHLHIWYLHAPFDSRLARYQSRDLNTGKRVTSLEEHDRALEDIGIFTLLNHASTVLCTNAPLNELRDQLSLRLAKLTAFNVPSNPLRSP